MIHVKIKNKLTLSFLYGTIFLTLSCSIYGKKHSNCIKLEKNNVCLSESENEYGEVLYYLILNNIKYPEVSYYENAKIIKLSNTSFDVITSFSDNGSTDIKTNLYLKDNKIFIKRINTSIRLNVYPKGAVENCYIELNKKFLNDIRYYVDNYIFNLNEIEKRKICRKIYNIN